MKYLIFIALGGASGAVARYLIATWIHELWEGHMPVGTLLVNFVGSFAMGVVFVLVIEKQMIHQDWRGVLMVGFLGAFTTFSTFSLETVALMEAGHLTQAVGYMLMSVVLCVLAAGSAIYLTRILA
jgi:CrcB protein